MTREPTCSRCFRVISADDAVELDGAGVAHIDCRRPRDLSREERSLLYGYCWAHPIACPACAQSFRLYELGSAHFMIPCPRCAADLTENIRGHLYSCSISPQVLRQKAREAREAARMLVKQAHERRDRADVLSREAEAAVAALRDAMKQSATEALRILIQTKLRDGTLPHGDIPATIPGRPGNGSICGACDHVVTSRNLMMIVTRRVSPISPHETMPIPLHADCRLL
jgi:hypothetical protein